MKLARLWAIVALLTITVAVAFVVRQATARPPTDWARAIQLAPTAAKKFYGGYDWTCNRYDADQVVCDGLSPSGNSEVFMLYGNGRFVAESPR